MVSAYIVSCFCFYRNVTVILDYKKTVYFSIDSVDGQKKRKEKALVTDT